MADFEVRRDDFRETRTVDGPPGDGAVRLKIDRFGLTANNVTYALMGDTLRYWRFFPPSEDGWGRVPVWGYGDVVASQVDGIAEGERFYGYFPMSSTIAMDAAAGGPGFFATDEHRRELPPVYNQYVRVRPGAPFEDEQLILRPLFATSVVLEDLLRKNDWYDADAIVLGSASSKTAYGLAFLLSEADDAPPVIGLTSERNRAFTESLGIYDRTLTYDAVDLDDTKTLFVDMSGDAAARNAVAAHKTVLVGVTHWEAADARTAGDAEFFFAPTHIERLLTEIGPAGLQQRIGAGWAKLALRLGDWLQIEHGEGPDAVAAAWRALTDGTADPARAQVLGL